MLRTPTTTAARAATRLTGVSRHLSSSAAVGLAASASGSASGAGANGGEGKKIENITVFGAGLMGAGVAQVAAHNGFKVVLSDVTDNALSSGKNIISKSLARVAKKAHPSSEDEQKKLVADVLGSIVTTTDPAEAVKNADLVIEAIIENEKIKQDLFKLLDEKAKKDAIFASNTSSLSVTKIAQAVSDERKKQFAGLHFFNPVPQMALVEVISTTNTSPETKQALLAVCEQMKKRAVSCNDTPGFIVNRLLVPYMLEAIRMVERGDATKEDVDAAMMLGAGYPMGPFQLADFVGLDTMSHIGRGWRESAAKGDVELEPSLVAEIPLLEEQVKAGRLGRKSGKGFYDY